MTPNSASPDEGQKWQAFGDKTCRVCQKTIPKGSYAIAFKAGQGVYEWAHEECTKMRPDYDDDVMFALENMSHDLAVIKEKVTMLYMKAYPPQEPPKVV